MNWNKGFVVAGLIGAGLLGATAQADTVQIDYNIAHDTDEGFAYSVFHIPKWHNGAQGWGSVAWRMVGGFSILFDEDAETFEFTDFNATIFQETDLNPDLGAQAGEVSFVSSSTFGVNGAGVTGGELTMHFEFGANPGPQANANSSGDITIVFPQIAFNPIANRFDTTTFDLGLWGATANVFNWHNPRGITGDTGIYKLGMDLRGDPSGPPVMIPLPGGASLAVMGFGALGLGRMTRRRR